MADAPQEPPKKHPGERLATFFDNFLKTFVGISTLGASITFSKIVAQETVPVPYGPFSFRTIQEFLGVAWLLFVLTLAATSFATCALSLYRPQAIRYFGTEDSEDRRTVMWYASIVSALLFGMIVVAFLFLALVVVGYAGSIGWTAVAFTSMVGVLGMGIIVWQSPIGSPAIGGMGPSRQGTGFDAYGSPVKNVMTESMYREDTIYEADDNYDARGGYEERRYEDGRMQEEYEKVGAESIARPVVAEVPSYLADMRRIRAIRISGDSGYGGRQY